MRKCKNCNFIVADSSNQCEVCGAVYTDEINPIVKVDTVERDQAEPKKQHKLKLGDSIQKVYELMRQNTITVNFIWLIIVLATAITPILGGIMFVLFIIWIAYTIIFTENNRQKSETFFKNKMFTLFQEHEEFVFERSEMPTVEKSPLETLLEELEE